MFWSKLMLYPGENTDVQILTPLESYDEITKNQIREMLEITEEVLEISGRRGSIGTEIPFCVISETNRKLKRLRSGSLCAAAKDFFVIDPSGYVRACNHSPKRLGTIFGEKSISDTDCWNMFAGRTCCKKYATPPLSQLPQNRPLNLYKTHKLEFPQKHL